MKSLLFVISLLLSSNVFAKSKDEQRIWLGIFAKKNLATHYDFWAEAQLRHDETNQTMNQTLNRFGILKSLDENHEIGFLFAYVQAGLIKEYRPTIQYVYKTKWNLNSFTVRNRLEARDIENEEADSIRFRSLLRYAHILNDKYEFVLWDEPFVNLTHETWSGDRFVERNRAFVGLRRNFNKANIEVGYMNQYIPRKAQNVSEHVLVLYLFL